MRQRGRDDQGSLWISCRFLITLPIFLSKLWLMHKVKKLVSHAGLRLAYPLTFVQETLDLTSSPIYKAKSSHFLFGIWPFRLSSLNFRDFLVYFTPSECNLNISWGWEECVFGNISQGLRFPCIWTDEEAVRLWARGAWAWRSSAQAGGLCLGWGVGVPSRPPMTLWRCFPGSLGQHQARETRPLSPCRGEERRNKQVNK